MEGITLCGVRKIPTPNNSIAHSIFPIALLHLPLFYTYDL